LAEDRYGFVRVADEVRRTKKVMEQYEAGRRELARAKLSTLPLFDAEDPVACPLFDAYKRALLTVAKKGKRHADAEGKLPLAPSSLRRSEGIVRAFVGWLRTKDPTVTTMDGVTEQTAAAYLTDLREGNAPAASYNRHLAELRVVWNRLAVVAGLDTNPFAKVQAMAADTVKSEAVGKRPFTMAELRTMQERASGWIRPAMFIGYFTGLRLESVCRLRWENIDLASGFIVADNLKAGKVQEFYCPEAMPYLQEWRSRPSGPSEPTEPAEYVFPRLAAAYLGLGRKPDQARASKEFTRFLVDVCGFTVQERDGKPVAKGGAPVLGFHSLRHAHATYSRGAGATVDQVQQQLGHSSGKVTAGYIAEDQVTRRRRLVEGHVALPLPGAAPAMLAALPAPTTPEGAPGRADVLARLQARLGAADVPVAVRADVLALVAELAQ
jgi:integrase